jgi:leucyl aminopeptidase
MRIIETREKLEKITADSIVIPLFQGEKPLGEVEKFSKMVSGSIYEAINLGDFKGKLYEVTSIYTHGKVSASRVFLVGAGKRGDFDSRAARNIIGAAVRRATKLNLKKIAVYLGNKIKPEEAIEGAVLANYDPGIHKTKKENSGEIEELSLIGRVDKKVIKKALIIAESTNWIRKMIHEPGNIVSPKEMVEQAKKLATEYKLDLEVIDEKDAAKRGFGAFAGIAKGSDEPSFIVCLKYKGGGKETLGVVGKGVTFDSGGISLKRAEKMHEMKMDMAGAAVCLGFMKVVGELRPKINVTMVTPFTENLPGGHALKPGDILTSLSGKTIEILSTDAEGRVVLADALTYTQKLGVTKIIDLATLTGAVEIALGSEAAAILGNKETFMKQIEEAATKAGERLWQLPIYPEHKELIKNEIADLANIPSSRGAGVIAGAVFLQEFVDDKIPWAHLDIAATAWLDSETPYLAKGPTGFGLRTLVELIDAG